MEYDEHEEQEEEIGSQVPPNYESLGNSGRLKMGTAGSGGEGASAVARKGGGGGGTYRYRECLKNHAIGIGGQAVDGCGEFMAAGEEGTLDALKCAACNCHRNFHRKDSEGEGFHQSYSHHQLHQFSTYYRTAHPAGYLHMTPQSHQRPLALPSTSREDQEDGSNPSSSGGGGGSGSKKRFRTKFSQEQKDKMLELAEGLGWRIQKHDEATVQQFCAETGVKRRILKC
ncbi:hypothetical protein F0562_035692 [Nyssa sinensis]|uniref:ZF-HD dimerization-type domain-containing protein n=1 Tax=Nyssa sinensis TaxID=561372 RepID=A0A5J5AFW6_9ASTE|nr:hypothetical protein F0562_035692 [Nyssa sinensis]